MTRSGDYPTTVSPALKTPTGLTITTEIVAGVGIRVYGALYNALSGYGIPGKPVDVYRNGVKITTLTTGTYGDYDYRDPIISPGTYTYYTYFAGDATYEACRSADSTQIIVRKRTSFDVTTAPPPTATEGETILFYGYLRDETGAGVDDRRVDLVRNGEKVDFYTTRAGGYWSFQFTLPAGVYTHYVSFDGDAFYEGCEEEVRGTNCPPIVLVGIALGLLGSLLKWGVKNVKKP